MEIILEILTRGIEQLFGRASGPFHLRLIITPSLATILAIRAGIKDARGGQPPFLWKILTNPAERQRLVHSGWKDIGKTAIVAFIFDTLYQLFVLRAFYVVQALIVVVVLAHRSLCSCPWYRHAPNTRLWQETDRASRPIGSQRKRRYARSPERPGPCR